MSNVKTYTLAVTGASGSVYFICLLKQLLISKARVNLLLSDAAKVVLQTELKVDAPENPDQLKSFFLKLCFNETAPKVYQQHLFLYTKSDWMSPVASGSAKTNAMIICPCSMGTLSAISHGASNNLIERAADVMLKESRQLILLTREMPVSAIHLENMLKLSRLGVTIMPASPGFYHQPKSINDLVEFVVARLLDHLKIEHSIGLIWGKDEVE